MRTAPAPQDLGGQEVRHPQIGRLQALPRRGSAGGVVRPLRIRHVRLQRGRGLRVPLHRRGRLRHRVRQGRRPSAMALAGNLP